MFTALNFVITSTPTNGVECALDLGIDVLSFFRAAMQNEIQRQQRINEVQQKRIEKLECHLHRQANRTCTCLTLFMLK